MPAGAADDPDPSRRLDTPISELRGRAGEPFTVDDVDGGDDAYRVVAVALANGGVAVTAQSLDSVERRTADHPQGVRHRNGARPARPRRCGVDHQPSGAQAAGGRRRDGAPDRCRQPQRPRRRAQHGARCRTPRRRTQRDALQAADVVRRKEHTEARLRQFVSDASHELRTPLAAILGYAELYDQQMARSPEQIDTAMRGIGTEAARMQTLVEDLLLLARLDEGRKLARDAVDLVSLVGEAVAAMRTIDHAHTIELVPPAQSIDVIGDELALRQVVDNLLSNVIAHTPAGTSATVTVGSATRLLDGIEHTGASIVVSDDGPGMSADHAARAFDRFYRAEQARSRPGGSGLGLAIVDQLVRAHDGTIDLTTAPGDGATFTIWLPSGPAATAVSPPSPNVAVASEDTHPSRDASVAP